MSENTNTLFWVITGAVIVVAIFGIVSYSNNTSVRKIFNEIGSYFNSDVSNDSVNKILSKFLQPSKVLFIDKILTLELLFTNGLIRKITSDTKYDGIIKFSIYSLNKNGYPNNLEEKVINFCDVLKDSHKLDLFRLVTNYPYIDTRIDNYPTSMVYNEFKLFRTIENKLTENNADEILSILSNIFSLKYKYSYYLAKNSNYITKLMYSLTYSEKSIKEFFSSLEQALNIYIERKIGDLYVRQEI